MTDVTSFETTKKLLEAGFPKSENWGVQYFIEETGRLNRQKIGDEVLGNGSINTIRASSATDILKVLGNNSSILYDAKSGQWICHNGLFIIGTCHENAAEAVAEMYLKVHSK